MCNAKEHYQLVEDRLCGSFSTGTSRADWVAALKHQQDHHAMKEHMPEGHQHAQLRDSGAHATSSVCENAQAGHAKDYASAYEC